MSASSSACEARLLGRLGGRDQGLHGRHRPLGPGFELLFSCYASFAGFDKAMADSQATWEGATEDERATLTKFMKEAVGSAVTNRYRLDPRQSYVNAETRAADPEFWEPK